MTAEIELLPLPEGESSSFGDYEVHTNETMIDYARANVSHATAALQAEVEALREDAYRYRWLRDKCDRWDGGLVVAKVTEFSLSSWSGDDLNASIDSAMRKESRK